MLVCSMVSPSRRSALGPSTGVTASAPAFAAAALGAAGAAGLACCAPASAAIVRKQQVSHITPIRFSRWFRLDVMFVVLALSKQKGDRPSQRFWIQPSRLAQ